MKITQRILLPKPLDITSDTILEVDIHDNESGCNYVYCHKIQPQVFDTLIFAKLSKVELEDMELESAETIILGKSNEK